MKALKRFCVATIDNKLSTETSKHSKRIKGIGDTIEHSMSIAVTVMYSSLNRDSAVQNIKSKMLAYMVNKARIQKLNWSTNTEKITTCCHCTLEELASAIYNYINSDCNDTEIWSIMQRGACKRSCKADMEYINEFKNNMNKLIRDFSRKDKSIKGL